MRRLLTSWSSLTLLLVVMVLGTGIFVQQLQRQISVRAEEGVVETARIVTALVVYANLTEADFVGTLVPVKQRVLDGEIAELLRQEQIVGLEIWGPDGHLLYADPNHPDAEKRMPATELERSRQGQHWVHITSGATEREVPTLEVFLPYDADGDGGSDGTVEVLLPQNRVTENIARTTRELYAASAAFFAALLVVLFSLRRRLLAREYDALHDSLTSLPNRAALRRQADAVIADSPAEGEGQAALLVIDLDGFKAVNDTLGHPAGDALLVQVARSLMASVRPSDLVTRLGGDEFAILLTNLPTGSTAEVVAMHVLDRLRADSYYVNGIELSVDASVGIALLPQHGQHVDVLLQRADVAMYEAKRTNAGVAMYDEANDPYDVGQLGLLVELRRAIELDELILHYQPKVHLRTGDLQGVEALVRWQHPTRGLLPPLEFIPLAENTGLMKPLTEWVLKHAIARAAEWRNEGLMIAVAVNIGPRTLLNRDLPGTLLSLLADAGLPAHLLELEITETAIMTDPVRAADVLGHLQAMGIRVAIDDFGVGYTSLGYLRSLPINTLKIDRCFITDMLNSDKDQAIAESVIGLGHKLGFTVVAEGIESQAILDRLESLNCDEGQGYHIGRPMAPEQLHEWIAHHLRRTILPVVGQSRSGE